MTEAAECERRCSFLSARGALHEDFILNLLNGAMGEGNKLCHLRVCVCVKSRTTMEDLDVPQMRREVESLQYQLAINREKSSITVTE